MDTSGPVLVALLGVACAIGATIFGCFVVPKIILVFSGWERLCELYPAKQTFNGPVIGFQCLNLGNARFNNCLNVGFAPSFLSLRLWRFSFPLAKEMQVPWSAVICVKEEQRLFGSDLIFHLEDGTRLAISKRPALSEALTNHFRAHGLTRLLEKTR